MKKAFITGINGQDGSYLAELLLSKEYIVHGIIRRSSVFNTQRIDHLMSDENVFNKRLFIHHGDVTDPANINQLISEIKPDEVYNLAAQSHVKVSFEIPEYTANIDALGVLRVLEAIKEFEDYTKKKIKWFKSTTKAKLELWLFLILIIVDIEHGLVK